MTRSSRTLTDANALFSAAQLKVTAALITLNRAHFLHECFSTRATERDVRRALADYERAAQRAAELHDVLQ